MQIAFKSTWISSRWSIIALITFSFFNTSCLNLYSELADKNSDGALFQEAMDFSNAKDFDSAINIVENQMSSGYQAKRNVQVFLASAYAGRCGLGYLQMAAAQLNATAGTSPMEVTLDQLKNSTSEADCKTAEGIMRTQSPAGDGIMSDNANDAFLMAMIALAKIGAILERVGDTGAGNPNNDGVIDAGFDACSVVTLPDADAREIATGLTLVNTNISASGTSFAGKMGALAGVCTAIGGTTCTNTNPATFTANEVKAMRGVVNYQTFGVGSDVAYTPCP